MKNKKISLFIVFVLGVMFFNIKEVKADMCMYEGSGERVTMTVDSYKYKIAIDGAFKMAYDIPTYENSVFRKENDLIYCPTKVYLRHDAGVEYSLATQTTNYKDEANIILSLKESSGGKIVEYEPEFNDSNEIVLCELGGEDKFDYKTRLDNIKNQYNNMKNAGENLAKDTTQLETFLTEIEDLQKDFSADTEKDKYCFFKSNNPNGYLAELEEISQGLVDLFIIRANKEIESDEERAAYIEKIQGRVETLKNEIIIDEFYLDTSDRTYSCEGLIADELEAVIQFALKVIRIGAPILLLVLCTIDFAQAVISGDKDALNKATSKVIKRAIAALALFLVPFFVSLTLEWIEDYNSDMNCMEVLE